MPAGGEVRMELSLSTRTVAGHRVLEVGGEIDVYTAPQLRERLISLVEGGDRHVIVDLAPVEVSLVDGDRFTVRVTDRAPIDAALSPALPDPPDPVALLDEAVGPAGDGDPASEEAVAVGMRLALLIGIVDDLSVRPVEEGPGTEVLMSWPTRPGRNGSGGLRLTRHP